MWRQVTCVRPAASQWRQADNLEGNICPYPYGKELVTRGVLWGLLLAAKLLARSRSSSHTQTLNLTAQEHRRCG